MPALALFIAGLHGPTVKWQQASNYERNSPEVTAALVLTSMPGLEDDGQGMGSALGLDRAPRCTQISRCMAPYWSHTQAGDHFLTTARERST